MEGLYSTCDLLKVAPVDDGYGAVKSTEVDVKLGISCRRSSLSALDVKTRQGVGSRKEWRFSLEPIGIDLPRNADGKEVLYVLRFDSQLYDVLYWENRVDDVGNLDHLEFRAEER